MDTVSRQISKIYIFVMLLLFGNINGQNPQDKNTLELHQQALDQTDEIDLIFELLEEAANKDKLNIKNKKDVLGKFESIRNIINIIKDTREANLPKIIYH